MKCLNFLLAALLLVAAQTGRAVTNLVTGVITTNTTLSGTNLLQGTVVVTNDAVLTLEPGTRMLMNTNAMLLVYGQLLANGTSNQPIFFTRATTAARWRQIGFRRAQASRFEHCVFEYANCAGTHLDYYDDDCNTNTVPPARNYHEAIVSLATHVDFAGCIFRNLVSSTGAAQGDALAIISDDPQLPGAASAHIWNSQFIGIGQGIHSRHSYLLVESNYFTAKNGDNDDVDIYGESSPPPVVRYNLFLNPNDDDMINPTRSSAIIYGNTVIGSTDHGIVLRDKCTPVVFNNLIMNCANGGISVQNQCDALIANNTIFNCGRGIRLFDHFTRRGPPYCLFPGSGQATVINTIIWDSSINSLTLTDSTNPFPHSVVAVFNCDIEGGQASASVAPLSTLVWGAGNINANPQFIGPATNNFRLLSNSPCIDAGTNVTAIATNFVVAITNDLDGIPRPLGGNGDGMAQFDIGAHEFLLATADSNSDGIPDGWTWRYGLDPTATNVASSNPDNDPHTTLQEWFADTNPTDPSSWFRITPCFNCGVLSTQEVVISFLSSTSRVYTLYSASNLVSDPAAWIPVPGQIDRPGNGATTVLRDSGAAARMFYRVLAEVP
ncbi:MAG: right-handed parallel beta-helix repeat-containing protein [Verrucomicrobia subdivision 3 bacterium]|nr:right-handed parallel beta-helix repeat-containing protein [Limisphaerales bacterium]